MFTPDAVSRPTPPRIKCPCCSRPVALKAMETLNECPSCNEPFRTMAINAMMNNTQLLADLNSLQQIWTECNEENDRLRAVTDAMTYAGEDPDEI